MRHSLAVFLFSLISALPAAAACPGTVTFQDTFTDTSSPFNGSTGNTSKTADGGGKLEVALLQPGVAHTLEYTGGTGPSANFCVTVAALATDKPADQAAGLVFWATDNTTYYTFQIAPVSGNFTVQLANASGWTVILPWTVSAAITKGVGVTNTLRVGISGGTVTLFINDQQVGTFTGTAPSGGGLAGMYAAAASSSPATWDFTNFAMTKP